MRKAIWLGAVLAGVAGLICPGSSLGQGPAPPPPGSAVSLAWPLECEPNRSCFLQNYFDEDPGPGAKDYRCGAMTYDGHDGLDIRLPTLAAMRRGVTVRASAAGIVKATRDGVPDISIRDPANPHTPNQDCGNAVIVDHPGGWQTIYCHMKRGSVLVRSGQAVSVGQPVGQVGLSGNTEFPHLHIGVRQGARKVDPFAFGPTRGQCGGGRNLWAPAVAAKLAYRSPQVINAGFADGPVTADQVDAEGLTPPKPASPLVAYVRAIGLRQGDLQNLRLGGPDGREMVTKTEPPLDHAKAVWLEFAGKKAPGGGWTKGRYTATYSVMRAGKLVLRQSWSLQL